MDTLLLVAALLVIAAILSTRFTQRFGVPALVLFVILGVLAGEAGPGGIQFTDYAFGVNAGMLALAVILFSGGLDTRARLFRISLVPATMLATWGVFVKMFVVGGVAWLVTPLDFLQALLLGAVLAPTDAAAVFSALKGRGLPTRLKGVLETESGTNDPVSIYLTFALTSVLLVGSVDIGEIVSGVVLQLIVGGAIGYLLGHALAWLINRVRIDSFGLYPVLALSGALAIYAVANLLEGNGFLAIYVVGLVLGNRPLSHGRNIKHFMDASAWGAQIAMFLLLGLLVSPSQLPAIIPTAIVVSLALVFVARPLAVFLSIEPIRFFTEHYRFDIREQILLSWAGLKGAVPIILALVPLTSQVPGALTMFNIVFVAVILSTLLQGSTVALVARWLGLTSAEPPAPPVSIDLGGAAPAGTVVLDLYLDERTPAVGRSLGDMDLPQHVVVAAIYRQGEMISPRGSTVFQEGDHVFIINTKADALGIPPVFSRRRDGEREPPPRAAGDSAVPNDGSPDANPSDPSSDPSPDPPADRLAGRRDDAN